jgi:hypothetical protein
MPIKFDLVKYKNSVFVETGTYRGASVLSAIEAGFDRIYSIEIDDQLYEEARQRFADYITSGKVILLHGDSAQKLPEIIEREKELCTFWLDAHSQKFNFDNETLGAENCPIFFELDTIAKSGRNDHTILIDDVRLIKNKNAWRGHNVTLEGVIEKLRAINPDYTLQYEPGHIEDDVLVATASPN